MKKTTTPTRPPMRLTLDRVSMRPLTSANLQEVVAAMPPPPVSAVDGCQT